MASIAAPVLLSDGQGGVQAVAALSVAGPTARITGRATTAPARAMEAGRQLGRSLEQALRSTL